jgi:hypothetical protein
LDRFEPRGAETLCVGAAPGKDMTVQYMLSFPPWRLDGCGDQGEGDLDVPVHGNSGGAAANTLSTMVTASMCIFESTSCRHEGRVHGPMHKMAARDGQCYGRCIYHASRPSKGARPCGIRGEQEVLFLVVSVLAVFLRDG